MTNKEFEASIKLILNNDKTGLEAIYKEYISSIYALVLSIVKSKENAEDITADFFIKLWSKANTYNFNGYHKRLLMTLAHNMSIDFIRKNSKEFLDEEKVHDSGDVPTINSPINYNDLKFPGGITPAEKYPSKNEDFISSSLSIIPFSEDLLNDTTWMGKVTILDAYYKDYKYDTFSDKFQPNERLHNWIKTIVYEVKANEVYLEDGTIKAGDTFKIEQQCFNGCYLTDSALYDLKINHQYILPLFYAGDKVLSEGSLDFQNFTEGDIVRDGQYSIVYSFAPQIEVTLDNEYIFHDGWESLINDKTIDVIMPADNTEENFYGDKMKLRHDIGFINDLNSLIKRYK